VAAGGAFLVPGGEATAELRIRGSRFLALAGPATSPAEAEAVVAGRAADMHDASHHCHAWRLRDGRSRANDDGEPGGSAGAPILAAVEGRGLFDCVVVVTRYFGGTKLGVGGLVRAYGDAAAAALEDLPIREALPGVQLRIAFPYQETATVMRLIETSGAVGIEHGYGAGGTEGEVTFSLPAAAEESFSVALTEASGGVLAASRVAEQLLYRPVRAGLASGGSSAAL
jgi:uncharacterized YigZ family protein